MAKTKRKITKNKEQPLFDLDSLKIIAIASLVFGVFRYSKNLQAKQQASNDRRITMIDSLIGDET